MFCKGIFTPCVGEDKMLKGVRCFKIKVSTIVRTKAKQTTNLRKDDEDDFK